jgi:pilus assembly protein CpaB
MSTVFLLGEEAEASARALNKSALMKKRLVIALACAGAAVVCGWLYTQSLEARVGGGRLTPILVAARELPAGTRISDGDLALRNIPESYLHPDSVLSSAANEKKIEGRPIAAHKSQGEPLLWSDFESTKGKLHKGLSGAVQKGQRAITLPVDVGGGFGNQLRAGDRVDVLGTFNRKDHEATVTVLQNVLVLSVGGERKEVDGEPMLQVSDLTLSLELDEAELLVFAQQHGTLSYVLHGDDDIDVITELQQKSFGDLFEDEKRTAMAVRRVKKHLGPTPLQPDLTARGGQ